MHRLKRAATSRMRQNKIKASRKRGFFMGRMCVRRAGDGASPDCTCVQSPRSIYGLMHQTHQHLFIPLRYKSGMQDESIDGALLALPVVGLPEQCRQWLQDYMETLHAFPEARTGPQWGYFARR